jgi:hypothetical protein
MQQQKLQITKIYTPVVSSHDLIPLTHTLPLTSSFLHNLLSLATLGPLFLVLHPAITPAIISTRTIALAGRNYSSNFSITLRWFWLWR